MISNPRKILNSLVENSDNDDLANFLKDIFIAERQQVYHWNAKYDELIEKYYKRYVNED